MTTALVTLLLDDYLSNALSLMHLSSGTKQLSQECEECFLVKRPHSKRQVGYSCFPLRGGLSPIGASVHRRKCGTSQFLVSVYWAHLHKALAIIHWVDRYEL